MWKFLDLQTMSARRRLWCAWPETSTQTTSQCPGRLTGGSKRSALRRTAEPSGPEGTTESAAGWGFLQGPGSRQEGDSPASCDSTMEQYTTIILLRLSASRVRLWASNLRTWRLLVLIRPLSPFTLPLGKAQGFSRGKYVWANLIQGGRASWCAPTLAEIQTKWTRITASSNNSGKWILCRQIRDGGADGESLLRGLHRQELHLRRLCGHSAVETPGRSNGSDSPPSRGKIRCVPRSPWHFLFSVCCRSRRGNAAAEAWTALLPRRRMTSCTWRHLKSCRKIRNNRSCIQSKPLYAKKKQKKTAYAYFLLNKSAKQSPFSHVFSFLGRVLTAQQPLYWENSLQFLLSTKTSDSERPLLKTDSSILSDNIILFT